MASVLLPGDSLLATIRVNYVATKVRELPIRV